MDVRDFAVKIAKREGLKKQVSIAQISEILRIIKAELDWKAGINLYKIIKLIKK